MIFKHIQQVLPFAILLSMATNSMAISAESTENIVSPEVTNPHSPAYGHPYRHGVLPTRAAHANMKVWATSTGAIRGAAPAPPLLSYNGGAVITNRPKVYLVVYGSQWGTQSTDGNGNLTFSGDALGAIPYLQKMFKGLGTGGELWSGVLTQYCIGARQGAQGCPIESFHVTYPLGAAFAGIWYDNSTPSPQSANGNQLANEAIRAAGHFGNITPGSNGNAQYVILSPSGTTPDGFNTASGNFCAWHDYNGDTNLRGGAAYSPYGDIIFTNMPYVADAGAGCGQGFVNAGTVQGQLDGFSIVAGHEYAEIITDPFPGSGWINPTNGMENGDECVWIYAGQGASANVAMSTGTFAMQSTWSNDTNRCDISHPIIYRSHIRY
jgi:serine protease